MAKMYKDSETGRFIIKVLLLFVVAMLVATFKANAQTKDLQLMHNKTWIGTIQLQKHSNSSSKFALEITNRTKKYIVLEVTIKDDERIVFQDLIRVGDKRPYYNFKAFNCYNKLQIFVRQRTNVRRGRNLEIL